MNSKNPDNLREVALMFLKLGMVAFGGPAAHIAMFRDEVVERRKWISHQRFLDLMGATSLIPGPNSTEMAIHIGLERAGWRGLIAAGTLFILPAFFMVTILAWLYQEYAEVPAVEWVLYGIKPIVIAVVINAIWGFGKTAFRTRWMTGTILIIIVAYIVGLNELILLFGGGFMGLVRGVLRTGRIPGVGGNRLGVVFPPGLLGILGLRVADEVSLTSLFLVFLKIGAVLYGSGYVLLAFLQGDFVDRLGWLSQQQLLDAVAIGQLTPGPVFTTATFIGYLLGGFPGAFVATLGIFLPSFVFVALLNPLISRLRASSITGSFLDGLNAAAIGLMVGVVWVLARSALVDITTWGAALVAVTLIVRFQVSSTWLISLGALIGVGARLIGG